MKIVVGSKNKVKILAVENTMKRIYPDQEIVLEGISVPSGISDQPMSDEEAIIGAKNRAKLALEDLQADFGFGLEGAVCEVGNMMFLTGWVAVCYRDGREGLASGARTELPKKVVEELRKGQKELGTIMDELTNQKNIKHGLGATGILTKGLKSRVGGFEDICISAMVRFISPELYN